MESKVLEESTERLRNLLRRKVPDLLLQAECGGGLELPDPLPWGFASVPTLYELTDTAKRDLRQLELERQRQRQQCRAKHDSRPENEGQHLPAPARQREDSGEDGVLTGLREDTIQQSPQLENNPTPANPGPGDEEAGASGAGPSTSTGLSPLCPGVQCRDGGGERPETSPPPLPSSPPPPLPEEESDATLGARPPSPAAPQSAYACTAFLDTLQCSRSFRSPHCEGAMAEALGLMDLYDGLSGSTLGPPPRREDLEAFRQLLKKHINARWALEAVKQGVAAAKQGNYADAHKCYDRALELDSSSAEAYVARGAAHANQRNFLEAEQDLRRALELDPSHRNAASYLAAVLQHAAKKDLEQQQQRQQQQSRAAGDERHLRTGQQEGQQEHEQGRQRQMGTGRRDDDRLGAPYQGCLENTGCPHSGEPQGRKFEGAGVDGRRRRSSSSGSSSSGEITVSSDGSEDNTPGAYRAGAVERPASDDIKRALDVVMKARKEKRKSKHKRHKKKHKKSKRRKGG